MKIFTLQITFALLRFNAEALAWNIPGDMLKRRDRLSKPATTKTK